MKKKLDKYDFLAINRRMNQNYNNPKGFMGVSTPKITHGEELKLNRKEKEKNRK